jgi:hypothetical protein
MRRSQPHDQSEREREEIVRREEGEKQASYDGKA